jgi:hypothetical protein
MAYAWTLAGSAGLIIFKMTIGFIVLGIVFFTLRSHQVELVLSAIFVLFALILTGPAIGSVRPQLFTILFFPLIILIMLQAEEGRYRLLWITPILFMLWPNLHGGFLAGIGILLAWGILHILFNRQSWQHVAIPLLLCLPATLVNPYGLNLIIFLLETATAPRPEIIEWAPISILSTLGFFYLALVILSVLGLIFTKEPRQPALIIVFVICAVLPLVAMRHLPLFGLASILIVGPHIRSAWRRGRPPRKTFSRLGWRIAFVPGIAAVFLLLLFKPSLSKIDIVEQFAFPIETVALLKESGVGGNLAVDFNWGEYVIWHLSPMIKVSMDGRRETVYSEEVYQQSLNYKFGVSQWDELLTDYDTDMSLVYKDFTTYNLLLLEEGWELIFVDDISALFVRVDSTQEEELRLALQDFSYSPSTNQFP